MKNILAFIVFLISFCCPGQNFRFNNDGSTEFIIRSADSIPASKLYSRTMKWIQRTYNNPKTTLKARTPNKMIKLDGILLSAFSNDNGPLSYNYDATYSLEIHYKKGRYRVKYQHHAIVTEGERPLFRFTDILNRNPDPKNKKWVSPRRQYEMRVQNLLNSLHRSISNKN